MSSWLEDGETNLFRQYENAKQACENDPTDFINLKKWAKSALGMVLSQGEFVERLEVAKTNLEKVFKESNEKDIDALIYLGWVHVTMLSMDRTIIGGGTDDDVIKELIENGYKHLQQVKKYAEEHPEVELGFDRHCNPSRLLELMDGIVKENYAYLFDKSSSSNEIDGTDEKDKEKEDLENRIYHAERNMTMAVALLGMCDGEQPLEKMEILTEAIRLLEAALALQPDDESAKKKLASAKMMGTDILLGLCDAEDNPPFKKIQFLADAIKLLVGVLAIQPDHKIAKEKLEIVKKKLVDTIENNYSDSSKGADERKDNKRTQED